MYRQKHADNQSDNLSRSHVFNNIPDLVAGIIRRILPPEMLKWESGFIG